MSKRWSRGREVALRLLRRKGALLGLLFLLALLTLSLTERWVLPFDALTQDFGSTLEGPSALHWFGTDELGCGLRLWAQQSHGAYRARPQTYRAHAAAPLRRVSGIDSRPP